MDFTYVIHFAVICISLLLGAFLRARIKLLQRYLIPSPIIGGVFLLLFYNYVAPKMGMNNVFLGDLVYHLLNVSFIAMMLRNPSEKRKNGSRGVKANVVGTIGQYGLQTFFGLVLAAILGATICKGLNPAFGFQLTLGFELGPGQAYSMSKVWESMGYEGAASVGLTMAAIGFLVGSVGGVILINTAIKRKWISEEQAEKLRSQGTRSGFIFSSKQPGAYNTTDGESIDSLTYHLALVAFTYFLSYLALSGMEKLLGLAGNMGLELAESLWGINFVFSSLLALLVRAVMTKLHVNQSIDTDTMNRISGLSTDFTVAASLGAISISTVSGYWLPIVLMVILGIFITCFVLPWYSSRLFDDNQFNRTLMLFGSATGTMPTGLSLLRVVDPNFESPAAQDFIYGTGLVFPLAIPLILSANLPAKSVLDGKPALLWISIAIAGAYLVGSIIAYVIMSKKRSFADRDKFFFVSRKKESEK